MSAARGQGDVRKRRLARLRARIVYLLARLNERSGWRMSKAHRDAYERSQGRRGARSVDAPILLLTTRGARSGRSHTVPVCCVPEPDGWVVASHAAGSGREPQWARNVAAGGSGEVLISGKRYRVAVDRVTEEERPLIQRKMAELNPAVPAYERRAQRRGRHVDYFRLRPTSDGR